VEILMLRFDAPLMSFGGVMVDQHGPTNRFPGPALLTGLFGNALGWRHGDFDKLQNLQARLRFAARWDVEPEPLLDYHTVDLGQDKMRQPGWTTHGVTEHRAGGSAARFGTHIRYRHYWANGVMTLAVGLTDDDAPNLAELESALRRPARPLFIGRKTCLPATPLSLGLLESENVLAALKTWPADRRRKMNSADFSACWPTDCAGADPSRQVACYDQREWQNQLLAGRRVQHEGRIPRGGR
jgi:CRISPR system Cascade subunit CasD